MSRDPFIGVGPGRCGTVSLRKIVGACKNTQVTHEAYPTLWYKADEFLGRLLIDARAASKSGLLFGEVAANMTPHVGTIRQSFSGLKVVCLHRDKREVADSFLRHMAGISYLRPRDIESRRRMQGVNAEVMDRFPVIDAATPLQAWEFYWEMCEALMAEISEPVMHMKTADLNSDIYVNELFDFLQIENQDRTLIEKRNWNSWEEILGDFRTDLDTHRVNGK